MGIQDLAAGGRDLAENMYGFNMAANATIEERVFEAAARIYESGVRVLGGQVMAGHNNVRADFAAAAFTESQLSLVRTYAVGKGDTELSMQIGMILERKRYMEDGNTEHLSNINEAGQKMVQSGTFKGRAPI